MSDGKGNVHVSVLSARRTEVLFTAQHLCVCANSFLITTLADTALFAQVGHPHTLSKKDAV